MCRTDGLPQEQLEEAQQDIAAAREEVAELPKYQKQVDDLKKRIATLQAQKAQGKEVAPPKRKPVR